MPDQIPLSSDARAEETVEDGLHEIAPDIAYRRLVFVNIVFFGRPDAGDRGFVLIDTGIPGTRADIVASAEARFGKGARPSAIILTHGHFDHVGDLRALAEEWDVPVYAHPMERPFLDGSRPYAPPDTKAGGGIMPKLSPLFPRGPTDISDRLRTLPEDGSVPGMPGWRWLHTPGHAPGHVSFWHADSRTLIAGDAIVTTGQESAYETAAQKPEMHGPPAYFTPDWASARASVQTIAGLKPELVVTGHGRAMQGPEMQAALQNLAENFDEIAVPKGGRYPDTAAGGN
ncbi:MBL fold metallo-hydrolase [Jiella sp. M17.18]|uniref:MBL fold metallo-hydrolase n=1 Tax=Jiella sp. M17.18 TaxID=3234247 RepID=UPI0034DF0D23